jgi:hypothetical protein
LPGFTTVKPGYNLSTSYILWGTANNASYLGGQPSANYFRNNINNTGTGTLTLTTDDGITLGASGDLTLSVAGTDAEIINNTLGGDVGIYANVSSTLTRYIYINGSSGNIEVAADPISTLGIATKGYVDNSFINANLTGISTAVTAPGGTSNTMIATTEFVASGLSGIFKYKIYDGAVGNNHFWIDSSIPAANLTIGGTLIMQAVDTGLDLKNGATAVTQPQTYTGAGNTKIATTSYVKTSQEWWGTGANASAKFVSISAPSAGINDGGSNNGDFWFQIAS